MTDKRTKKTMSIGNGKRSKKNTVRKNDLCFFNFQSLYKNHPTTTLASLTNMRNCRKREGRKQKSIIKR